MTNRESCWRRHNHKRKGGKQVSYTKDFLGLKRLVDRRFCRAKVHSTYMPDGASLTLWLKSLVATTGVKRFYESGR